MIILGENRDDKGTQLELLTKKILEFNGYKNIVKSNIGPGGEEIDVTGEYRLPNINGNSVARKLICECKAHNNNNNMNDWLKFLGKVFVEEIERNEEVFGCFIALTGVNGNVQGCYESIKNKKNNISLIIGDNLFDICKQIFNICKLEEISNKIKKYTNRQARMIDIVYYDLSCYWVIVYENFDYTILSSDNNFVINEKLELLIKLINNSNNLSLKNYVDLEEEARGIKRKNILKSVILSEIIENMGKWLINKTSYREINFTEEEINLTINELIESGFVIKEDKEISFLKDSDEGFYSQLIEIYKFLFNNLLIVEKVIGCKYYDEYINKKLVENILEIQGNIKLSTEEVNEVINVLRLSPTSLIYSLYPDEIIVNHRKDNSIINEKFNLEDKNYYLRKIHSFIKKDFINPSLNKYFYNIRNIREIETLEEIKVKTDEKIINENKLHERIGVGQLDESLGSGYINILIRSDCEQPWDLYNKNKES